MLQSLLQPRDPRTSKMIGAMPAVAVRHERRRQEKRNRRPSQLTLQPARGVNSTSSTPTPPAEYHRSHNGNNTNYLVCVRISALHIVVGSILMGIVVMVVGLVQLSPGAEAAQHRYALIGGGVALTVFGIVGAVVRCICVHMHEKMLYDQQNGPHVVHHNTAKATTVNKNGVQTVHEKAKVTVKINTPPPEPKS